MPRSNKGNIDYIFDNNKCALLVIPVSYNPMMRCRRVWQHLRPARVGAPPVWPLVYLARTPAIHHRFRSMHVCHYALISHV